MSDDDLVEPAASREFVRLAEAVGCLVAQVEEAFRRFEPVHRISNEMLDDDKVALRQFAKASKALRGALDSLDAVPETPQAAFWLVSPLLRADLMAQLDALEAHVGYLAEHQRNHNRRGGLNLGAVTVARAVAVLFGEVLAREVTCGRDQYTGQPSTPFARAVMAALTIFEVGTPEKDIERHGAFVIRRVAGRDGMRIAEVRPIERHADWEHYAEAAQAWWRDRELPTRL